MQELSESQGDLSINRRTANKLLGVGLLSLFAGGYSRMADSKPASQDLSFVHPELRDLAPQLIKTAEEFKLTPELIAAARSAGSGQSKPFRTDIPVVEKSIPGTEGNPDVLIYIVNASSEASRPAILHTHGGGYILGSAESSVRDMQDLASELDCTVITVDYRLAPETTYVGSIEDNYAALKWSYTNARELGIDPDRIAVMGESAGGGHAALLAITARDRGEVPLIFQCLVYPMLDDRTGISRPVPATIGSFGWTVESNIFGWRAFLGQEPGTPTVPPKAVPARVSDLSGLPPAFIGVGGIDLFVDEDVEYAQRLIDAGVPVQLLVQPGAFHGFDVFGADTEIGKRFTAAKIDALRRAFDGQFA